jgi:hypothetical protein
MRQPHNDNGSLGGNRSGRTRLFPACCLPDKRLLTPCLFSLFVSAPLWFFGSDWKGKFFSPPGRPESRRSALFSLFRIKMAAVVAFERMRKQHNGASHAQCSWRGQLGSRSRIERL